MIDHMGISVSDLDRSRKFYEAALGPLDMEKVGEGTHVAFKVDHRDQVDAFHAAGVGAGGRDNGGPGFSTTLPAELLCRVRL
jgi:catechol-2,3-dioxygenase